MSPSIMHNSAGSLAVSPLPPSFDMRRVITGVHKYLNPARDGFLLQYHVSEVKNGISYVTFALPTGMVNGFVQLLQSMASMFKCVDIKEKTVAAQQKAKCVPLDELGRRKKHMEYTTKVICDRYDKYIQQGHSLKEAISLTNSALKTNHDWVTYEIVKSILSTNGRFKKR